MWLTRGCGSFSVVQVRGSSKNPVRIPSEGGQSPKRYTPLVWPEVTDFQLDRAVQNGMIPRHYMVSDATKRLKGYVEVYLNEEIKSSPTGALTTRRRLMPLSEMPALPLK